MTDPRSLEQRAADDALRQAIQDTLAAYGWGEGILTDWIVVTASQRFDDDGHAVTSVAKLVDEDIVPHYRLMGLLDQALTELRAEVTTPDD